MALYDPTVKADGVCCVMWIEKWVVGWEVGAWPNSLDLCPHLSVTQLANEVSFEGGSCHLGVSKGPLVFCLGPVSW